MAEITFNMWYQLSEEVYHRDYQPLRDVFKPHIERLIGALARHCQCEPDHTNLPDEGDDFYVCLLLNHFIVLIKLHGLMIIRLGNSCNCPV